MKNGVSQGMVGGVPPLFREVQRFRQWFFWVPIAVVTVVVWYMFVQQVVLGNPQGEDPVPNWAAWVMAIIFGLGFPALASVIRLITEVRPGALSVRLVPFSTKHIPLTDVGSAYSRDYSPMREYGGWGIRMSRNGRAYNAYGNQGVQLQLRDGEKVLIGTQVPEELLGALRLGGADLD